MWVAARSGRPARFATDPLSTLLRAGDAELVIGSKAMKGAEDERPPGAWWLPHTYGGSAPTLEEAERIDAEEKRLRAERKAAKAAGKRR